MKNLYIVSWYSFTNYFSAIMLVRIMDSVYEGM